MAPTASQDGGFSPISVLSYPGKPVHPAISGHQGIFVSMTFLTTLAALMIHCLSADRLFVLTVSSPLPTYLLRQDSPL